MERITFSSYDDFEEANTLKEISFDFDGSMEQFIKNVRAFAVALSFTEGTVDNWIRDPYDC